MMTIDYTTYIIIKTYIDFILFQESTYLLKIVCQEEMEPIHSCITSIKIITCISKNWIGLPEW
jgi:hypothetical protein